MNAGDTARKKDTGEIKIVGAGAKGVAAVHAVEDPASGASASARATDSHAAIGAAAAPARTTTPRSVYAGSRPASASATAVPAGAAAHAGATTAAAYSRFSSAYKHTSAYENSFQNSFFKRLLLAAVIVICFSILVATSSCGNSPKVQSCTITDGNGYSYQVNYQGADGVSLQGDGQQFCLQGSDGLVLLEGSFFDTGRFGKYEGTNQNVDWKSASVNGMNAKMYTLSRASNAGFKLEDGTSKVEKISHADVTMLQITPVGAPSPLDVYSYGSFDDTCKVMQDLSVTLVS